MIEYLGLLYGLYKDIKQYLGYDENIKTVDEKWLEGSGFKQRMESVGYKLRWTNDEKVESRKLDGYETLYEIDKIKRIRRIIQRGGVTRDPQILMGKKTS